MARESTIRTAAGGRVRVLVAGSREEFGRAAAGEVTERIAAGRGDGRPVVLGLPAGRSAIPLYEQIVHLYRSGEVSFRRAETFNLDEYLGIPPFRRGSFRRFMDEHLFDHVDLPGGRAHFLDGLTRDPEGACARYEQEIRRAGGIDLQVLGIGPNGHIAFNEPGSRPDCRTRKVRLTDRTIDHNAEFFGGRDEVPAFALTMGIGTILEARRICLVAEGEAKAEVLRASLLDSPSETLPASCLQGFEGGLVYVLDDEAASRLGCAR